MTEKRTKQIAILLALNALGFATTARASKPVPFGGSGGTALDINRLIQNTLARKIGLKGSNQPTPASLPLAQSPLTGADLTLMFGLDPLMKEIEAGTRKPETNVATLAFSESRPFGRMQYPTPLQPFAAAKCGSGTEQFSVGQLGLSCGLYESGRDQIYSAHLNSLFRVSLPWFNNDGLGETSPAVYEGYESYTFAARVLGVPKTQWDTKVADAPLGGSDPVVMAIDAQAQRFEAFKDAAARVLAADEVFEASPAE